ncbi:hypothetical protein C8Q75DRAFT_728566, partial [Abortiporus biennis]
LVGNITAFEVNIEKVASIINREMIPQLPSILLEVLSITFIRKGPLPKNWLKSTYRVHHFAVASALKFLKVNNRYYVDIKIDEKRLKLLLEDNVSDEIIATLK